MTTRAPDADRRNVAADPLEALLVAREIERFLIGEVALLDERRFEDWAALFTEDGRYWAPALPDQASPDDHVSLFFDDRELMATRFARLRHPRVHAQIPPSRTSHMVSNVTADPPVRAADGYDVTARFIVLEHRPGVGQRTFGGRYDYRLVRDGGTFRIRSKKATVLNCDDVMEPLSLPF
jgi:benzoate/toluate 1,2-dioxygenase beta subunit